MSLPTRKLYILFYALPVQDLQRVFVPLFLLLHPQMHHLMV